MAFGIYRSQYVYRYLDMDQEGSRLSSLHGHYGYDQIHVYESLQPRGCE